MVVACHLHQTTTWAIADLTIKMYQSQMWKRYDVVNIRFKIVAKLWTTAIEAPNCAPSSSLLHMQEAYNMPTPAFSVSIARVDGSVNILIQKIKYKMNKERASFGIWTRDVDFNFNQ